MERADCHCHTYYSDGSLSPAALLACAKQKGLTGLSITDHDTLAAYPEAIATARALDVTLISGIEISAEYEKHSIHVLGYAFDVNDPSLQQFCEHLQTQRTARNHEICDRLSQAGLPLAYDDLKIRFPQGTIGRLHIATVLVEKGLVSSLRHAFEKYLGNERRGYVPGFHVSVEEAIEHIQRANGFAILAHPHQIRPLRILPALCAMPFDGIEAYYSHYSLADNQPWLTLAQKKNWLVTGGSDFHRPQKNYIALGCAFTPLAIFEILKNRYMASMHLNSAGLTRE